MKNRYAVLAALIAAMPGVSAADDSDWSREDAFQGQRMALQYRVDNWDMFTNVKVDPVTFGNCYPVDCPPDEPQAEYMLSGLMASWYPAEYLLGPVRVGYIPEYRILTFGRPQEVMSRDGITWSLYNLTEDESIDDNEVRLRLDESSPHGDWRLMTRANSGSGQYYSGGFMLASECDPVPGEEEIEIRTLYMFRDLSLHPYNGHMVYDFLDMYGREYHNESVVHTWVDGMNLVVRNFSNVGFDYDVFFTIDPVAKTVTARGQVLLDDPDMLGECVLGAANDDGSPATAAGERHTLTGTFVLEEVDGHIETTIDFPVWGAYNERNYNFFNPTSNTRIFVGYDILDPASSVATPVADLNAAGEPVYYNLQGVRIAAPVPGQVCLERRGSQTRKFLAR